MIKQYKKGQTLLEALIALSALLLILSAISIVTVTALSNSTFAKNQNLANKYAQEGMEYLRNYKIRNFSTFINNMIGIHCMAENSDIDPVQSTSCNVNIDNTFKRQVDFAADDKCPNGKLVTVTVSWTSGKCQITDGRATFCHKAEFVSCLIDNNLNLTPTVNP